MVNSSDEQILTLLQRRVSIHYAEHTEDVTIENKPAEPAQVEALNRLLKDGLVLLEQHIQEEGEEGDLTVCGLRRVRLTDFGRRMVNS